jgi:protein phosphatase
VSANEAGGHDNVTVVVVKFTGSGLKEPGPDDEPVSYRKYSFSATEGPPSDPSSPGGERGTFSDTKRLPAFGRGEAGSDGGEEGSGSMPNGSSLSAEESVAVPLEGLPPKTVGVIIMAGVTLIIAMGFYLLN